MAWDSKGNVVVADCGNHRLQVVRLSDGAFPRSAGSAGSGAGRFNGPFSVAFDSAGNIIVADHGNHRVQVLRYSDGSHLRTIGSKGRGNGQLNFPCSVAVSGSVLVHDGVRNGRIQVFHMSDGALVPSMCSRDSGPRADQRLGQRCVGWARQRCSG